MEYKVPVVSITGAAFGLSISEFVSEFVARTSAQTGWYKFGVKALVKSAFGVFFYALASQFSGMWSLALEIGSYTSFASIIPDFFMAWNPGGLIGWAEAAAVGARGATRSVGQITAELSRVEGGAPYITSRT